MKVEVEVINEFTDLIYGKKRTIGEKFVCSKELALERKNLSINGKNKPLVKILREVADDYPEEPKAQFQKIHNIFNQFFKK